MNHVAADSFYKNYYKKTPPNSMKVDPEHDIDDLITNLIRNAHITKETNAFFKQARKIKRLDPYPAMIIAANWREITKTFMFTTLMGIGHFAEKIGFFYSPDTRLLNVLQTSVSVISDDLNNVFKVFKEQAPKGAAGIHYLWWENTILNPLLEACEGNTSEACTPLTSIKNLTTGMAKISNDIMGFAVQLRVVEAIALDIVLAFRPLFSAVEVKGKKLFSKRADLNWIYSHITAEVVHNHQVQDKDSGMMIIAHTPEEKQKAALLAEGYIELWAGVFDEFAQILSAHAHDPLSISHVI